MNPSIDVLLPPGSRSPERDRLTRDDLDPGAFIGHEPELGADTIDDLDPKAERVAAGERERDPSGADPARARGEWPGGHRHEAADDEPRRAGRNR